MKRQCSFLFIALCIVAFISIGFNYYLIHELDERDLYCDKIMKEYEEYILHRGWENNTDSTFLHGNVKEWHSHR